MHIVSETRNMGFTHREFFHPLDSAVAPYSSSINDNVISVDCGDNGSVQITLGEEKVRAIALLRIPYMNVTFEFTDMPEDFREEFTRKFHMYYQRGGG